MTDLLLDKDTIGIDVALLEVNGELVADKGDVDEVCSGKSSISVALTLMQVKTSTAVDSKEILNFGDTVKKVLSNNVPSNYPKLRAISQALFRVYDGYASKLKERPRVNLAYVSTANDAALEDSNVRDRVGTVRTDLRALPYVGEIKL